jgi:hypothetical protein
MVLGKKLVLPWEKLGFWRDWAPSMAENKPEGPAGDCHREILWKLPKLTEKLKNTKISSFVKKKLKKQKPKKSIKNFFKSGCLGTNDEPGVFAILMMKIESEIGIV